MPAKKRPETPAKRKPRKKTSADSSLQPELFDFDADGDEKPDTAASPETAAKKTAKKRTVKKKTTAKKKAAKKSAKKKTTAKKSARKKTTAKKSARKKTTAKKSARKKTTAKKKAAAKTSAEKTKAAGKKADGGKGTDDTATAGENNELDPDLEAQIAASQSLRAIDPEDDIVDDDDVVETNADVEIPHADGDDGDRPVEPHLVEEEDDDPSSLRRMMSAYFMEYASYVIKERAIPDLNDGFKPVQRRILHTLYEMDDGKLHKVANVVGSTMKYHPHGDSSIYSALVHVANKEFFIERQGNFGNILTGDPPSAARYIECRLSEMAREVLFRKDLTEYTDSYDGRNREPVSLPARVPVLLMQGSEGIAVGMSTRIVPHNFVELLEAQIKILRKQDYKIYPDFLQGGIMDVSEYDRGRGRIKLRAKIDTPNEKTLIIREIPASTTTESLINSIENAVQKGKIKISAINDFTADEVEIEIRLPRGIYADDMIKALYAYTDCEVSISCNCLVIKDNQPVTLDVNEVLEYNTFKLRDDLHRELVIDLGKLIDQYHFKSLVQIFIENRIYKRIEQCTSFEGVKKAVRKGLEPFVDALVCPAATELARIEETELQVREITDEDIDKLLQIPIRRISQFDIDRNKDELNALVDKSEELLKNLRNLTKYTIRYIRELIKKYGDNHKRRTQIEDIEQVDVREVALKNLKVGLDRKSGFVGTAVKDDNPIACTEYDRLVIIKWDGTFMVVPVPEKLYVGPVCAVYKANREQVYSMVYRERKSRVCYAKRFQVSSYIMEKEYKAVPKGCKVEKVFDRYGVVLNCQFRPKPRLRDKGCELDFNDIEIRKATARGFKIASHDIAKFIQVKRGSISPDGFDEEDEDDDE